MKHKKFGTYVAEIIKHLPIQHLAKEKYKGEKKFKYDYLNEKLVIDGKHETTSNRQSVIFFTVHKSASVFVGTILKTIASSVGITPIDLPAYLFSIGIEPYAYLKQKGNFDKIYKKNGYSYGPYREFLPYIPDLGAYKIVLMLRDPRDVLVSLYYSAGYSHNIPSRKGGISEILQTMRVSASETSIDSFVLDYADVFLNRYEAYCHRLLKSNHVFFTKYEEMVFDFNIWLDKMLVFLDIDLKRNIKKEIARNAQFSTQSEDKYSHKRQVAPGDHCRKLQLETIAKLNLKFQSILAILDYHIE